MQGQLQELHVSDTLEAVHHILAPHVLAVTAQGGPPPSRFTRVLGEAFDPGHLVGKFSLVREISLPVLNGSMCDGDICPTPALTSLMFGCRLNTKLEKAHKMHQK